MPTPMYCVSEPGELIDTNDGSLLNETKLLNYKIILLGEPGEPNLIY